MNRNPGPGLDYGADSFLVVGSSNSRRLTDALDKKGVPTGYVFSHNWRATKKSVSDMAAHIKEERQTRHYTATIFMMLDNNVFFVQGEDGSKSLPKKGPDGKFHVDGDLTIADKDGQFALLKLCEPLWEAAKGTSMVVVSPMPRFITSGCCAKPDHTTNRSQADFYSKMREELAGCTANIKDYLFTSGMRHGRVMDPARSLRGLVAAEIWGNNPVHPREEIYGMIADGVREVVKTCGSGQQKRKPMSTGGSGGGGSTASGRGGHIPPRSGGPGSERTSRGPHEERTTTGRSFNNSAAGPDGRGSWHWRGGGRGGRGGWRGPPWVVRI